LLVTKTLDKKTGAQENEKQKDAASHDRLLLPSLFQRQAEPELSNLLLSNLFLSLYFWLVFLLLS